MVLPTWHIPPNMGGPEVQFGTLRGELEIGPKISPRWALHQHTFPMVSLNIFGHDS